MLDDELDNDDCFGLAKYLLYNFDGSMNPKCFEKQILKIEKLEELARLGQAVIDKVKSNRQNYGGDLADLGSKDGWEMYADIDGMVE